MWVVGEWVDALRATLSDVILVGFDCGLIGLRGFVVLTDADVHVCRHVNQMPRSRRALGQARCRRQGTFRFVRGFDQVNIEMIGHLVVGRRLERTFEQGQDLGRPWARLTGFELVEVPRVQVHERLHRQDGRIDVVRILRGQLLHRLCVRLVERSPILGRHFDIPRRQSRDVVLLLGTHLWSQCLCRAECLPGLGARFGGHRCVDVGTEHVGDPPPAHRATLIELGRVSERTLRFGMIESERQNHSLIKIALSQRG